MNTQTTLEAPAAFLQIPLASIVESPTNPRKAFDDQGMEELIISVREKDVIQPILVRPAAEGGGYKYEIVFGARRFRASKAAGKETIPAQVRNVSDQEDHSRKEFGKKLMVKKDSYGWMTRGDMGLYEALKELSLVQLEELVQAMVRPIILKAFPIKDRPDWTRHGEIATLREIAALYAPGKVAELDAEQEEKASKRKTKVYWRIEDLRKKSDS